MNTVLTLPEFLLQTTNTFSKHSNSVHLLMSMFKNNPDNIFDRTINDKLISLNLQVEADKTVFQEALVFMKVDMATKPKLLNVLQARVDLVLMYINRALIEIDIVRHLATQEELELG